MRRSLPDDEHAVVTRFRAHQRKFEMPLHMQALLGVILAGCLLVNWVTFLKSDW
jgi:hypothetical protein